MIEDLKQNYLIKGTSCNKVFEILDKAENIDTTAFEIHWTYSIGSNPGFHVDPYYLIVDFDLDENLTKNRVIEH